MSVYRPYLKSVHLRGFKTIRDLTAEFDPGFNIIIGKNGGGKTNFFTFLNNALLNNSNALIDTYYELDYSGPKNVQIIADRLLEKNEIVNHSNKDILALINSGKGKFKIKTDEVDQEYDTWEELTKEHIQDTVTINPVFIPHGLRLEKNNRLVNGPLSFSLSTKSERTLNSDLIDVYFDKENSFYLRSIAFELIFHINDIRNIPNSCDESVVEVNLSRFLNVNINSYLPIEEVRLNSNFTTSFDTKSDSINISNLSYEYKVNDTWLPYSNLSDGTKRLIGIFLDVISYKASNGYENFFQNRIILLEEPELGIHPHLFTGILNFLKEYSQYIQIIITTHAPLSLNSLSVDELNLINVCKNDLERGTLITKLTEEQIDHAKLYMSEMYLSDYWQYSSLEEA